MTETSDDIKQLQAATTAMQSTASALREMAVAAQNVVTSTQVYAQAARPVYEEFYQRLILKNAIGKAFPKNRS